MGRVVSRPNRLQAFNAQRSKAAEPLIRPGITIERHRSSRMRAQRNPIVSVGISVPTPIVTCQPPPAGWGQREPPVRQSVCTDAPAAHGLTCDLPRTTSAGDAVVWGFLGDDDVVWVAFTQAGRCDADELGVILEGVDGRCATIAHRGSQAADQLVDDRR